MASDFSADSASEPFSSFEKELQRRGTSTTRSRDDKLRTSALVETWFRVFRPGFVNVVGESDAIQKVDDELQAIRKQIGSRVSVEDLRKSLRRICRLIDADIAPSYEVARWTSAKAGATEGGTPRYTDIFAERLGEVDPGLAASYEQALRDLGDETRSTYMGPAGEIREVFRGLIHHLAPDEDVQAKDWYKGSDGRPTQAERVRYAREMYGLTEPGSKAAEMIDVRVGQIARATYSRASKALHSGTERREVQSVLLYVQAIINELLPDSGES